MVAYSLVLSSVLFTVGVLAVLMRRNPLIMFMGIELMLNAANLAFIAFARHLNQLDGQLFALIIMAVAAAEVAVGLAIIVAIYRYRRDVDVDAVSKLRG
ncbi:MAG: NADH-quinone oxidoreductase subunit K [Candidatus Riflebacteria bacterium RBG_13_59_9]|nr:MAG: NADH-quinone oxidoreductase subunit K [Candidatus Riflebacteria bacterium RBG_13_59_9]